jgi:hypothetical protein
VQQLEDRAIDDEPVAVTDHRQLLDHAVVITPL